MSLILFQARRVSFSPLVGDIKPNTLYAMVNIVILIRESVGYDDKILIKFKTEIQKIINTAKTVSKIEKKNDLPTMKEIYDFMNNCTNVKQYIVNYLLIHYGVRNKDLNCVVIKKKNELDNVLNYFLVMKTKIIWVINDYKTRATYGQKIITINDKKFIKRCQELENHSWLLTPKPSKLEDGSLGHTVSRLLYNNLNESDYFKIVLQYINTKPDTTKWLKHYSASRGTSLNVLINNYDVLTD